MSVTCDGTRHILAARQDGDSLEARALAIGKGLETGATDGQGIGSNERICSALGAMGRQGPQTYAWKLA